MRGPGIRTNPDLMPCWNGPLPIPDIRMADELKPVLAEPACRCEGEMVPGCCRVRVREEGFECSKCRRRP